MNTETTDYERAFQRERRRWGNLKARIRQEIAALSSPSLSPMQRSQYANGVARLNWVLDQMAKSADALDEVVAGKDRA